MNKYWLTLTLCLLSSCASVDTAELRLLNDADLIRREHLLYWTGLIEEYEAKTGAYPFQAELDSPQAIGLVNIPTAQQRSRLNENLAERYVIKTVGELVAELESVLARPIDEMCDF